MSEGLKAGLTHEMERQVTEDLSAQKVFPHVPDVYATRAVLAVLMQLVAEALVGPAIKRDLPFAAVLKRWGIGMALRFVGIVVLAGAAVADPKVFPPLPAAMGYLGVLLPLLIVETRLLR